MLADPKLASHHFMSGGGEMGALMCSHDWSATPLGSPGGWPQSLRTSIRIMLNTRHPMYIWWGPELFCFYNDAYRQSIGPERHPGSLGQPAHSVWAEIWDIIGPQIDTVMSGQGATWHENALVPITRNGIREDVYWTYSYGPIDDDEAANGIGGVLVVCTETTAHVENARRLAESQERLQLALSGGRGVGTWDWDVPADRVVADERFARLYGVDPERAKAGAPIAEFFTAMHPDDIARVRERIAEAMRTGESFSEEYRLVRADGNESWVVAEGRCERAPDGTPLRFPGVSFDITDRKRAEQRLRDLNAELECKVVERAVAQDRTWRHSPDLLSVINMNDGTFDKVNPAWTLALGWATEEMEGVTFATFVHPDDIDASAVAFEQVLRGEPVLRFENRYRTKEGAWRWLSWVAVPEGDRLYSSTRDVTEEREQAAILAERTAERNLLAQVVESTDTLVLVSGLDYNILAINKANADAFEQVYGIRPKVGDNMLALLADQPEHQDAVRIGWSRALAGEEVTYVEEYGDPERSRPYFEIKFRNLFNEAGERIGAYQFVTDVTERLHQQAELAAAQEALRQSQKMEAIGQLTGGVAHDFNNLLTVIRGSIDLMRRGTLPEERRQRHMQAISDTVTRATRLTQQLLAFARRQTLQPEAIDVGKSMRTVSEMLATLSGSRVEIIPYAPTEPCFVNVDPSQFDTALVNMAVNARDAMDGEGTLTIRVKPVSVMPAIRNHPIVQSEFVAVSLTDTGSGIPEDQLDHIFEPFFTTKAAGAGTGLGLSQVFGFAKQSGGEVMVESTVGKGTTFTLYLPRVEAPEESEEAPEPEQALDGNGTRVLLVEDNEEVGSFATQALVDLGYVAIWSLNANEALAELDKDVTRFDVVFSDVIMPGMSGIDLAHEIRRRHPALPVVLTSGYSGVLAQGGTHGFELLHKPYSVEGLSRVLGKAAAKGRQVSIASSQIETAQVGQRPT